MKAVMLSIQPKWCEKIASGKKTVEVRKTRPKIETPFMCYIYATKRKKYYRVSKSLAATDENLYLAKGKVQMCDGFQFWAEGTEYERLNGKVIGEFVCDRIGDMRDIERDPTCLSIEEWLKYTDGHKGIVYGWHISDLVIYDKPKELGEFTGLRNTKFGYEPIKIKRPPQSWCYVEVQE